nr:MAG TPA: hypothetical protein [Caudoviricetes sp.]DAQ85117.1 MAG TPA: hypothetical protein [Caudoviricetes sp.]DAR04275.1 MAG TPA: hypothetical protein [Caudoviricetes sp.]DAT67800.1 MAG TPA: hypothetical protein [Caudoviricetes sp.]DAW00704.1 MAG TPA: hypothetical protein [Caudoviricetes sp.]
MRARFARVFTIGNLIFQCSYCVNGARCVIMAP